MEFYTSECGQKYRVKAQRLTSCGPGGSAGFSILPQFAGGTFSTTTLIDTRGVFFRTFSSNPSRINLKFYLNPAAVVPDRFFLCISNQLNLKLPFRGITFTGFYGKYLFTVVPCDPGQAVLFFLVLK